MSPRALAEEFEAISEFELEVGSAEDPRATDVALDLLMCSLIVGDGAEPEVSW